MTAAPAHQGDVPVPAVRGGEHLRAIPARRSARACATVLSPADEFALGGPPARAGLEHAADRAPTQQPAGRDDPREGRGHGDRAGAAGRSAPADSPTMRYRGRPIAMLTATPMYSATMPSEKRIAPALRSDDHHGRRPARRRVARSPPVIDQQDGASTADRPKKTPRTLTSRRPRVPAREHHPPEVREPGAQRVARRPVALLAQWTGRGRYGRRPTRARRRGRRPPGVGGDAAADLPSTRR